jgi:hypothetical protein
VFARQVSLHLKPNTPFAEFTRTFDHDVIPVLRKQKGFQDEITLVNPAGNEVTAISLWDQKQNAEDYDRSAYPEILTLLSKVIEGTPSVNMSEVGTATFSKAASARSMS